jgi:NUMOD4 motif
MIKALPGELWKPLQFPGWKQLRNKYALSSHGRIASFKNDVLQDGKLLQGSITTGYKTLNLHRPGNNGTLYIHREIARLFNKKPSLKHKYVIHLNHDKTDNSFKNLAWATLDKMIDHQQKSPAKVAYKKVQSNRTVGLKLSAAQVKSIKKTLDNPKRNITIKKLAEKFKVSEMTMYRIKSGENWGRIKQ